MKTILLGTIFGNIALRARDSFGLMKAIYDAPEIVGMLLNDQLASALVARLCLPSKVFIDVGAHIGSVLSAVAKCDPTVKLIGIEAIPEKIANLRKRFPAVELHQCALGDLDGQAAPFFVNTKHSGYSSLGRGLNPSGLGTAHVVEIKVPLKKLDSIISSEDIDVIKIDVEGAELGVLRGGEQIIGRCRPSIMFESAPATEDGLGYSKEALWSWLDEHRFDVIVPNRVAHNGPGLSLSGFVEAHFYPRRTTNYFAIPQERRGEVRERMRKLLKMNKGD